MERNDRGGQCYHNPLIENFKTYINFNKMITLQLFRGGGGGGVTVIGWPFYRGTGGGGVNFFISGGVCVCTYRSP